MNEDEYIDLDKINVMPNGQEMSGFTKEKKEQKPHVTNTQTQQTQIVDEKKANTTTNKTNTTNSKSTVKKKKTKKTNNKTKATSKPKKQKINKKPIYMLIGIILLAIIVITLATTLSNKKETNEEKVLMLINGAPLYEEEVQTRADWLRLLNGIPITDEEALELSIETDLLYQEANKRNLSFDENELDEIFTEMADSVQMTNQELQEYIEGFKIDYETLRQIFRKELIAGNFAEQEMYDKEITEEEMKQYYEENKQTFLYPEHIKMNHIQISYDNKTNEETLKEAENILQQLNENKSNFCELVKEYTDELNTANTCGEYNIETEITHEDELFAKALNLDDGDVKIIQTTDGYHVVLRRETKAAGINAYNDVKEIIKTKLITEHAQKKYAELLTQLKEDAIIEDYTGTTNNVENEEVIEIDLSDLLNETNNDELDENEQIEEEITINETTEKDVVESTEEKTEEEKTEDTKLESKIIYEETITESEDVRKLKLAKCLSNNSVKMYGVYWSPDTKNQAEEFGENFKHIISIECDAEGVNPKQAECKNVLKKQYPTWPTWLINGELHEGYQNLNNLARLSGCTY